MLELNGKYGKAKVFTDIVENEAIKQVISLLNEPFIENQRIRMMPDIHAGAGCVVGTTMTIQDKVVPNLVGVDIGCGVYVGKIKQKDVDFEKLDKIIRENIPSGFDVRQTPLYEKWEPLNNLVCRDHINKGRALSSLGTLGGGNHFIELAKDNNGHLYLLIHTGSRSLGLSIAKHYQNVAIEELEGQSEVIEITIKELKEAGREKEISETIAEIKKNRKAINKDLAYLKGQSMKNYMNDIDIAQQYAFLNRQLIAKEIIRNMEWDIDESFQTIHNYIDIKNNILRKGAVSAQSGEKLVIPINMRDGSLICIGKGNPDWNYSAPHGAGRILSRNKAKEALDMETFKSTMEGIYTTSITKDTLDEAPMAYKPIESIMENIQDTVSILEVIKPVYNYKAS